MNQENNNQKQGNCKEWSRFGEFFVSLNPEGKLHVRSRGAEIQLVPALQGFFIWDWKNPGSFKLSSAVIHVVGPEE